MSFFLTRNDNLLSTMYLQNKRISLDGFVELAHRCGFSGIEVSHIITEAHLSGLSKQSRYVKSVHAPAPKRSHTGPRDAIRLISSTDEEERRWAVEQVKNSIRWAAGMGIPSICLHLGTVEGVAREEWVLEQRFLAGQRHTARYQHQLESVKQLRRERAPAYFNAARRSLEVLVMEAEKHGVRIGLESRRYPFEIPNLEEMHILLQEYDAATVGFWYDTGHCRVTANLGFDSEEAWLERVGDRIVGVHVHDVVGLRDHLLPGMGEIDFAAKAPHIPATAIITWEVDWYFAEEELQFYRRGMDAINA